MGITMRSDAMSAATIQEWTRAHVLVSWSAQKNLSPVPIVEAHASTLVGADGSTYLDFSSGLINVNLGHGHPRVVRAIQEQAARLCYVTPSFASDSRAALARALHEVSPGQALTKTLFTTGGAEANESAIKIARMVTGRHKILTAYRSYHGATYGAVSIVRFFAPYPYRSPFVNAGGGETAAALRHIEDIIGYEGPQHIAALMIEPVVGTNGVIVYPDGYLQGLRDLCTRHGILLVFDEVMTGFGRTGRFWGSENWNVVPELMTFAKGVTSGYIPLGGVSVSSTVAGYFDDHTLWTGLTYSGHPLACAAGAATVAAYREEGLIERGRVVGRTLEQHLRRLQEAHPSVGEVRGLGLYYAIELVKNRATREMLVPWNGPGQGVMAEITRDLMKRGVYVYGRWNILFIAPPLVITEEEIGRAVEALDGALTIADRAAG